MSALRNAADTTALYRPIVSMLAGCSTEQVPEAAGSYKAVQMQGGEQPVHVTGTTRMLTGWLGKPTNCSSSSSSSSSSSPRLRTTPHVDQHAPGAFGMQAL